MALVLCLALAALVRSESPSKVAVQDLGLSPEKLAGVETLLRDAVTERRIAGGSALVIRRGRVVLSTTVGYQDVSYGLFDRPVLGAIYRDRDISDGLIETSWSMAENVRRMAGAPLLHQPGSAWEYGLVSYLYDWVDTATNSVLVLPC